MADYELMHKDVKVCTLSIDERGSIRSTRDVTSPEHLPVGTGGDSGVDLTLGLDSWWNHRSIPANRDNLQHLLSRSGIETPAALTAATHGLSLSDCYWIREAGSTFRWVDINYYDNGFSEDLGMILFGADIEDISLKTPDTTSDGRLKKRWSIIDGRRCLIKGGSAPFYQEPFDEVIASEIMRRLGIDGVDYRIGRVGKESVSICDDFADGSNELVPATAVNKISQRSDGTNYEHTVGCFRKIGLEDPEGCLDRMLVLDFIIANEDRHYGNFGVLRDPDDLVCTGFAPPMTAAPPSGTARSPRSSSKDTTSRANPSRKSIPSRSILFIHSIGWISPNSMESKILFAEHSKDRDTSMPSAPTP